MGHVGTIMVVEVGGTIVKYGQRLGVVLLFMKTAFPRNIVTVTLLLKVTVLTYSSVQKY